MRNDAPPTKFKGDILKVIFHEKSNLPDVTQLVLKAFEGGIMMFKFEFKFRRRTFRDCVCLPADSTEADAIEMAQIQFARFKNTVAKLLN